MSTVQAPEATHRTLAERLAEGKALRQRVPRSAHAHWEPVANRPDPVVLLESSNAGRVHDLIPIRYGRMLPSPFTFLRGSAAAMAFDLAATPATGIHVQLCGDAHLMNFGGFGTPERNFIFDLTDFDETLPGPWEWDVKRLAASVVAAARFLGHSERQAEEAVLGCVRSYRRHMHRFAAMHVLDLWYARVDGTALLDLMAGDKAHGNGQPAGAPGPHESGHLFVKITEVVDGRRRFRDVPPLIFHPPHGSHFEDDIRRFLAHYRATLQDDRRTLLSRYHEVDVAMKVVGVGSVGTRCAIMLLMADEDDGLVLQYKEAWPSVLEPYAGKSKYASHGQRVVCGQRLLQSASDLFLGWASDEQGVHFYFRQLRDMKTTVRLDGMSAAALLRYAKLCGRALARGHARAGDPALISGYLGRGDAFDRALATFARTYADQNERDHAAMVAAVKSGRLVAHTEPAR
jgi:uncharacterized protein (DUF2252 family)